LCDRNGFSRCSGKLFAADYLSENFEEFLGQVQPFIPHHAKVRVRNTLPHYVKVRVRIGIICFIMSCRYRNTFLIIPMSGSGLPSLSCQGQDQNFLLSTCQGQDQNYLLIMPRSMSSGLLHHHAKVRVRTTSLPGQGQVRTSFFPVPKPEA
jgi:hypothetical protein